MKISGWGKFPFIEANVSSPNTFDDLLRDVKKELQLLAAMAVLMAIVQ